MTNTPTKTYLVGVIERAIAYYMVDAVDPRTAAENWHEGELHERDDEALESDGPCNVRVKLPDGTWMKLPRSDWEADSATGINPAGRLWSVLLLYSDHANASGSETYFALVEAADAIDAFTVAQRAAVAAQEGMAVEPEDFMPLLVTAGHHASEPLFNK
jgi:hypothetical protein